MLALDSDFCRKCRFFPYNWSAFLMSPRGSQASSNLPKKDILPYRQECSVNGHQPEVRRVPPNRGFLIKNKEPGVIARLFASSAIYLPSAQSSEPWHPAGHGESEDRVLHARGSLCQRSWEKPLALHSAWLLSSLSS